LADWRAARPRRDQLLRQVCSCGVKPALAELLDDFLLELKRFSALARHLAAHHPDPAWQAAAAEVVDGADKYQRFMLSDGRTFARLEQLAADLVEQAASCANGPEAERADAALQLVRALRSGIQLHGNLHDVSNPLQLYCMEAGDPQQQLLRQLQQQERRLVEVVQQLATCGVPWQLPDEAYLERLQQALQQPAPAAAPPAAEGAAGPERQQEQPAPVGHHTPAPAAQAPPPAGAAAAAEAPAVVSLTPALLYRMLTSPDEQLRRDAYQRGVLPRCAALQDACRQLAAVREQLAALNEQDSYAQMMLGGSTLAQSPQAVLAFLQELLAALRPAADAQLAALAELQQQLEPGSHLQPWDLERLQAQVRGRAPSRGRWLAPPPGRPPP
jgi:Zn-dependent oligopeptidase